MKDPKLRIYSQTNVSNSGKNIDSETIKRFKEDDMSAFDIIYRSYSEKLYRFAYSIIKVKPDAEGIVHFEFSYQYVR